MARNPRLFLHNGYYEISFRTEEGLPLVCSPIIEVILKGALAKAATLYPVTLCKFMMMGNHIHLGLVVINPEHVHLFISYLKRELAHAINRLLGRRRRTVWQESYDAVLILDTEKAVDRSTYVYSNPVRADLVKTVAAYPGFSSWGMFNGDTCTLTAKRIPRGAIPKLPNKSLSMKQQRALAKELEESATEKNTITFKPDAWLASMPDGKVYTPKSIRQEIRRRVSAEEVAAAKKRKGPVLGAHSLGLQNIKRAFTPKKYGKKMLCFGSTPKIRMPFLTWYTAQRELRKQLKESLPIQQYVCKLPPGFFAPGGWLQANACLSSQAF